MLDDLSREEFDMARRHCRGRLVVSSLLEAETPLSKLVVHVRSSRRALSLQRSPVLQQFLLQFLLLLLLFWFRRFRLLRL